MEDKELKNLQKEVKSAQVLILAGGKAKRMNSPETPKALLPLNGSTLIDNTIEQYRNCGFTNFVLLLRYQHEKIEKHLGDGSSMGVKISYSVEPEDGMGKGKALRYAVDSGAIDLEKRALVCFPDDIMLDKSLPLRLMLNHLYGVRAFGALATVVFVAGTQYPYGVAELDEDGLVKHFIEKPFIPKITSVGSYALEPGVYEAIKKTVDMKTKGAVEFESSTLPYLAERKRIYSMIMPSGCWFSVNTQKEYENIMKYFKENDPE